MDKYQKYQTEDFLQDESFINWVLDPEGAGNQACFEPPCPVLCQRFAQVDEVSWLTASGDSTGRKIHFEDVQTIR